LDCPAFANRVAGFRGFPGIGKPLFALMDLGDKPDKVAENQRSVVEEIASFLEGLREDGLAILMVEHELSMVERLCDPVLVMAQGRIIGRGPMSALRQRREIVDAYLVG